VAEEKEEWEDEEGDEERERELFFRSLESGDKSGVNSDDSEYLRSIDNHLGWLVLIVKISLLFILFFSFIGMLIFLGS